MSIHFNQSIFHDQIKYQATPSNDQPSPSPRSLSTLAKMATIAGSTLLGAGVIAAIAPTAPISLPTIAVLGVGVGIGMITGFALILITELFLKWWKSKTTSNKPTEDTEAKAIDELAKTLEGCLELDREGSTSVKNQDLEPLLDLCDKIREAANRDLMLDEAFIEKKFDVKSVLDSLPSSEREARRSLLQSVINKAYVTRELKLKSGLITGQEEEAILLNNLGYPLSPESKYYDKELIYFIVQQMITQELSHEVYEKPLHTFKKAVQLCSLKARLQTVGLTDEERIQKFQAAYTFFMKTKSEFSKFNKELALNLKFLGNFPFGTDSITTKYLKNTLLFVQNQQTEQAINKYFSLSQVKKLFNDKETKTEDFIKRLENHRDKYINRDELQAQWQSIEENEVMQEHIKFYAKWGKHFVLEFIQGSDDEHTILGKGVCWGICQRIRLEAQANPDMTPEELASHIHLTKKDRYLQVIHQMNKGDNRSALPSRFHQQGLKDQLVLEMDYKANNPSLNEWLTTVDFADSSGWLRMSFSMCGPETEESEPETETKGHAILIRQDKQRQRFWAFDPNIGFLCFESPDQSSEESHAQLLNFLKDLIGLSYPTTYAIHAYQLASSFVT